jgi:hypothetical protein
MGGILGDVKLLFGGYLTGSAGARLTGFPGGQDCPQKKGRGYDQGQNCGGLGRPEKCLRMASGRHFWIKNGPGLPVFKRGGPLLDKGRHALFLVLGRKSGMKHPPLEANALGQRGLKGLIYAFFDGPKGQ